MLPLVSAENVGRSVHESKIGIIDIGSNSVRLVIYDALKRTPLPIFNEKIFCQLGKGLATSGKLNPEGVKMAEAAFGRFLMLSRIMDVVELDVIATAAVRDAEDGPKFVEQLEKKYRLEIQVISGKKEARLGAYGVLSSFHEPEGISGDLGGGSMEFVALESGKIRDSMTLPIGPLRLLDESGGSAEKIQKLVEKQLKNLDWMKKKYPTFYAIGGSFRALAKMHMAESHYPLKILHHYSVPAERMQAFCQRIMRMDKDEIARLPGASSKRAQALIPASTILASLLDITKFDLVSFSTNGIREGVLYEKLSPYVKADDPLISASADLARQVGRLNNYGRELFEWTSALFPKESEASARIRLAACILSDVAWRLHPEYRAESAFYRVVQSSLTGVTHAERVALALAVFHRYQVKSKASFPLLELLDEKTRRWARLVGMANNLGFQLSGGIPGNLEYTELTLHNGEGRLSYAPEMGELIGDTVKKRLEGLGEILKAS